MARAPEAPRTKVHWSPIWRDRANFIISIDLERSGYCEQLWAFTADALRFEICGIPLFAYNLALGDFVETDHECNLVRVVEPSGRSTFRAWFGETQYRQASIVGELTQCGVLTEPYSTKLLGIDAADPEQAETVSKFLAHHEARGYLIYEVGRR